MFPLTPTCAFKAHHVQVIWAVAADESVPEGIPPTVPWDDLAASQKWASAQLKKAQAVGGKLNVPRERFRVTEEGEFLWAGKN